MSQKFQSLFVVMLSLILMRPLAAEEVKSPPSPYSLAQGIQKLQQDLASCEHNLMQSEKMQHQLRAKIAHTLPALLRYVRRNSLEFMTRPQHQHKAAKERGLIGSINTHLFQRFANEQLNYSENAALYTMTRNALNIKKDVTSQLVTLHKEYIQAQKDKIKALERTEKEKINNKKLSVDELINESLIARGQKPLLSTSEDGLAIVRLTLPLQGKIVGLYDVHTRYSTHGRGVVFEGKKGGVIVAPMHGVVKYIGKFQGHDPIAILNHGDLTTIVIIGAESFSVQPGQSIYMGQSIGKLPGYGANAPRLYMELRHKGKYIDPTPFFSDNGSN